MFYNSLECKKKELVFLLSTKEKPILRRKKLQNTSLQEKELAIILGGLLGDGSLLIYPNSKNARYSFRHSLKKKSYFNFKAACLKSLSRKPTESIHLKGQGLFFTEKKLCFYTKALSSLTTIHSVVSPKNKLEIKRKWLNHLTPLSLAIWWFDDGSIIGSGRKGCISTEGFSLKYHTVLIQYLKVVWDIEASFSPVKNYKKKEKEKTSRGYDSYSIRYRIYLNTSNLKKFLTIILPYVPCMDMLYKCTLKYKDSILQERWISHMEQLVPCYYKSLLRDYIEQKLRK